MATQLNPTKQQEITVFVNGPEDANRLILCNGEVHLFMSAGNSNRESSTFTFVVGPTIKRKEFVRATASVSFTSQGFGITPGNIPTNVTAGGSWNVVLTEADWDDETNQVEVRVELELVGDTGLFVNVSAFSYNVSILAAISPT